MAHKESCKKCKAAFLKALTKEFGEVTEQWKSGWPCRIDEILSIPQITKATARSLEKIYKALQDHRGHHDFVGQQKLSGCDYYIKSLNCIVEFDESQHFTAPRAIALSEYPESFQFGFSKKEWANRCNNLNRRDNDPPHRDETRAWYDVLRDIMPSIYGMRPTLRVYSKDIVWCKEYDEVFKIIENLKKKLRIVKGVIMKSKTRNPIDFSAVRRSHIIRAIKEIEDVPEIRKGKTFVQTEKGKLPAKYVLERAWGIAHNKELFPEQHTGGDSSANILDQLGFKIFKNKKSWKRQIKTSYTLIRVFLSGDYGDEEKFNDHGVWQFNKWVSKQNGVGGISRKRLKNIFENIKKVNGSLDNTIILFPACTLVYKKGKESSANIKAVRNMLKKESKSATFIMGVCEVKQSSYKDEYISIWNKSKEFKSSPGNSRIEMPIGQGWVYISSNIKKHKEESDHGKYCFDLGHGAYQNRHWNTCKSVSKKANLSVILTSWTKSKTMSSWVYTKGEKEEKKAVISKNDTTDNHDRIDFFKKSFSNKIFS